MIFIESPLLGYLPTFCSGGLVVDGTVNGSTRRRRPGRSLTVGCIISVEIFFISDVICWGYGDWYESFYSFNISDHTLDTRELVVDDSVHVKENLKEKNKEVADIPMYHISRNFLQLGRDMVCWWWLTWKLFILSTCLTTFSTSELVVDGSVDGKGNKEGKMAADIRIYLLCWNLL